MSTERRYDDIWNIAKKDNKEGGTNDQAKVRDFFDEHKNFFETYAGDYSIRVEKSPEGLDAFDIDLEKGVLYGEPKYFTEKGYSENKAFFAFLHEFEHFRELRELLKEKNGERVWLRHRNRLKGKKRLKLFDNVWDDVRTNRSVVSRAPAQAEAREALYRENLFVENNFSNLPKHLQFAYALLREANIPEEECVVSDDVRAEIKRLRQIKSKSGISLLNYASRPDISPSLRIELQEKLLEPVYERFFQDDVEQKRKEKAEQMKSEGKGDGEIADAMPQNPEDFFKDKYQEYFDQNPDSAIPDEAVEEAVKKYVEGQKEKGPKSEKDLIEEAYAREQGVSAEDLREYQKFWQEIEELRNPETDERVVEELRALFRKIIAERMRPRQKPKLPESFGEILARPAEAVAAIKAGIGEPEVWETIQEKERPKELFGDFDITIIADRSGSMDESDDQGAVKKNEQKKAVILLLEALKEFANDLEEARADLQKNLNVQTEVRSFGSESENEILKPLSEELTEKQRVAAYKKLGEVPGSSTKDFLALESYERNITDEEIENITAKNLKKILLVLSDGESDDAGRVQRILEKIREKGVIARGIGITRKASSIKQTYKPHALISERADQLAVVLAELLKEYLRYSELRN